MREAGILIPLASLPSDYGIGEMGKHSYEFVDLLKQSNIKIWQILPLNPLGFGNSPYQPYSSFAGDEIYISLEQLYKDDYLDEKPETFNVEVTTLDYAAVREFKQKYLKQAFLNFKPDNSYEEFASQEWVYLYAVFLTFKKKNNLVCWNKWKDEHKNWIKDRKYDLSEYEADIKYEMFVQYIFYKQWMKLKEYANKNGIKVMGDIPIYVGIDSLDVWSNQENFLLDENGEPIFIAGVPPDYFSKTGQRWGNPIYNWDYMKQNDFKFWKDRFSYNSKLFDIIRIDHFRAFDTYWKIPSECETAIDGEWIEAPGYDLFDTVLDSSLKEKIVVEDLGDLRPEVHKLRDYYNFKGMKIIQFAFDPSENNNNFEDREQLIVYTGTHDNQTIKGWYDSQSKIVKKEIDLELFSYGYRKGTISHRFIEYALNSIAEIAIIPMQDILDLDDSARLNTPGTVGSPNWEWKLKDFTKFKNNIPFLAKAVKDSGRLDGIKYNTQKTMPILEKYLKRYFDKTIKDCTNEEIYVALVNMVKVLANQKQQKYDQQMNSILDDESKKESKKKLYYISAEFLIGKLLSNNLINLGIYKDVKEFLEENNKVLSQIEEIELEPSLGNGGLGRLAACFLDSIATLGLNGDGIGLNYHFGLFKQEFKDNLQYETKNSWITKRGWLTEKEDNSGYLSYKVKFKDFEVVSKLYDIDVIGYKYNDSKENKLNGRINKLHLFDIETLNEDLVTDDIEFDKDDIKHNLTLFLYPDDSDEKGKLLRIYQQYFMVSNAAQYILDECIQKGSNLHDLSDYAVIQINDTHPTMIIPELIRLLNERGIGMDEAINIVSSICAYTNHTILSEALEKWPIEYLNKTVPQIVPIIEALDNKIRRKYKDESLYIIDDNNVVHMAHIDIHYGFSVNGVASLHTDILKKEELNKFYNLYNNKFNNKTNGITFRRWLLYCNYDLSQYLVSVIGDKFKLDATKLENLLDYIDDEKVLTKLLEIKTKNKLALKNYLKSTQNILIDENSIFDIQVKRLHEYKRQQMNALYAIYKYLEIKKGNVPATPITMIFGAKAAPAYVIAKDIIHLLLCLQELINSDKDVNKYLKLIFVENYNVTKAEKLIPACDISEQISLASKEASGTGNMKFMLNGAVTLGTMDGANVEIYDLVGKDNIYIFGQSSDEVIEHYKNNDYVSKNYYQNDKLIKTLVDFIVSDEMLKIGHKENLERIYDELINKDWFMTLLDINDYIQTKEKAFKDYEDRTNWAKKMLTNIAKSGYFSSDRTIEEYNKDIWKLYHLKSES